MTTVDTRTEPTLEEAVTHLEAAKEHLRQDEAPETQARLDMALQELQQVTR